MPSSLIKSKKKLLCTQNKLSFLMVCKNKKNSPYYITTWWWSKCKHEIIFGFNTCLKKKKKFHTTKYFLWNSVFKPFVVFPFFFHVPFLSFDFILFFPTLQFFTFVGLSFLTLGYIQLDLLITHKSKHIFFFSFFLEYLLLFNGNFF